MLQKNNAKSWEQLNAEEIVDRIREVLGFAPLYNNGATQKPKLTEGEHYLNSYTHCLGDGNKRVEPKGSAQ
jgi:hypothetical protein